MVDSYCQFVDKFSPSACLGFSMVDVVDFIDMMQYVA